MANWTLIRLQHAYLHFIFLGRLTWRANNLRVNMDFYFQLPNADLQGVRSCSLIFLSINETIYFFSYVVIDYPGNYTTYEHT